MIWLMSECSCFLVDAYACNAGLLVVIYDETPCEGIQLYQGQDHTDFHMTSKCSFNHLTHFSSSF